MPRSRGWLALLVFCLLLTAVGCARMRGGTGSDPVAGSNAVRVELVPVKGGCFEMGDPRGDERDERPHPVCVADFLIGRYEVTQGEWQAVMGANPAVFSACGADCPVENVSWLDVQRFLQEVNRPGGTVYRLPTEAEWEYAARGATGSRYAGSDEPGEAGWVLDNAGGTTHPVGGKRPNSRGLYDMTGNVWEWVSDRYALGLFEVDAGREPAATQSEWRVLRGGSYKSNAYDCRVTFRYADLPDHRNSSYGFRLAASDH